MKAGNRWLMLVGGLALLVSCKPGYVQSPVDGGGVSFDFAQLSAEQFKDDATSPNLLDTTKFKPNAPYIGGGSKLKVDWKTLEKGTKRVFDDGVWSIVTDAQIVDQLCAGERRATDAMVSAWSAPVPIGANDKGCHVRVAFKYRTHRAPGRNGTTWCIPFDTMKPGSAASIRIETTDSFWYPFVREFEIAPGIEKFNLCMRLDGPGDFEFKDVSVRRIVEPKGSMPVDIVASPHGYLGRDYAIASNQCGIINYVWRRRKPIQWSPARDYVFTFEADRGFDVVEMIFGDYKSLKKTVRPDGVTVATIEGLINPGKDYNTWTRLGVMVTSHAPVGTRGKGRFSCTYKGKPCANAVELDLFVIPEITARKPTRYMNGFGHASSYGFTPRGEEGRNKLADLMAACGIDLCYPVKEFVPYLRKRGMRHILGGISASNGFQIGDGKHLPDDEKYVALNPKAHWGIDYATCPASVYLEKPFFKTNTVPRFKRELEGFDGAIMNWEPFYFARQGCMCDTCCREFAKWAKLDYDDVKKDWPDCIDREKGRFGKRIVEFRSWQHGRLMRTINKYVTQFSGGENSMGFVPEVEYGMMTSNWRDTHIFEEVEIKDYGATFKWINAWGPYSGVWDLAMPYVHSPATWTADFYGARNIRKQARADYPNLKIMSFPMGYLGNWVVEPEILEMNLNAYFFNGWEASCIYFFPCGYDCRYWAAIARATTLAADYENVVWDGVRMDERVVLTPDPDFPPPSDNVSNPHFPEFTHVSLLQHVAYEYKGKRYVAAFNYRADGPANFTLRFTDMTGEWKLTVPACRTVVFEFEKGK